MTIKRDILGTIVNIELTDDEITKAHISYLEREIKDLSEWQKLSGELKAQTQDSMMPDTEEPDYMIKLRECDKKLRAVGKNTTALRSDILKEYEEYITKAFCDGMTYTNLEAILGVKRQTIQCHISRYRMKNAIHAA